LRVEPYDDEIMSWHYEPPYDFYDTDADPPEDPAKFRVVRGDDGRVDAFWYFDRPEPGVVEVGIGLRPDLVGCGLGERFLRAELDYARKQWGPDTFRLFVTDWNARATALYRRVGFREVGERHVRSLERFGDHVFLRMERAA
jgi:[ribosomal protein S18]-alanine N-acetyltransferase